MANDIKVQQKMLIPSEKKLMNIIPAKDADDLKNIEILIHTDKNTEA